MKHMKVLEDFPIPNSKQLIRSSVSKGRPYSFRIVSFYVSTEVLTVTSLFLFLICCSFSVTLKETFRPISMKFSDFTQNNFLKKLHVIFYWSFLPVPRYFRFYIFVCSRFSQKVSKIKLSNFRRFQIVHSRSALLISKHIPKLPVVNI